MTEASGLVPRMGAWAAQGKGWSGIAGPRTLGPGLSAPRRAWHLRWGLRGWWAVGQEPALGFSGLLRQLRMEARLTQEELAEAARLSPRTVSDLERGVNRTAHKDTAGLLADALGLAASAREVLVTVRGAPRRGLVGLRAGARG